MNLISELYLSHLEYLCILGLFFLSSVCLCYRFSTGKVYCLWHMYVRFLLFAAIPFRPTLVRSSVLFSFVIMFICSSRWSPDRLLEGLLFIYLPLYFLSHLYLYHELVRFLLFAAILLWPTLVHSSVLFSFVIIYWSLEQISVRLLGILLFVC